LPVAPVLVADLVSMHDFDTPTQSFQGPFRV
jgi:hypothetical protein